MLHKDAIRLEKIGDSKYYGSTIYTPDGSITVWLGGEHIPSDRQLQVWGVTLEEARADDYMCDGHYETATTYRACELIVDALRQGGFGVTP